MIRKRCFGYLNAYCLLACLHILACSSGNPPGPTDVEVGDAFFEVPEKIASSDPNLVGELSGSPGLVVLNEVLLTSTENSSSTDMVQLAAEMDGEVVGHVPEIRLWQIRIDNDGGSPEVIAAALDTCRKGAAAEHCFPNSVLFTQDVYPDDGYEWNGKTDDCTCAEAWEDPDIRNQTWGQWAIDLPEAWSLTTGSPEVPIAVLDEGVFIKHRDFGGAGSLKFGSSWKNGHGTHVAGILGARGDNQKDIAGVNWQAPLWFYELQGLWGKEPVSPVVIGGVPLSAAQSAFIHAGLDGVRLVNFSFGRAWKDDDLAGKKWCPGDGKAAGGYSAEEWQSWLEADRKAWRPVMKVLQKHGVLVVAAAGNNSAVFSNNCEVDAKWTGGPQAAAEEFPDNVLVVASVGDPTDAGTYFGEWADQWHALSPFSSTGAGVAVAAPGSMILSLCQFGSLTCPTSHTYYASGTSMAAPFVTGLASLVWSLRPEFTPGEVKAKIIAGARQAGPQVYRRVNPGQAEPVIMYDFHVINAYETLKIVDRSLGCTDDDEDGYGKAEAGGATGLDCVADKVDCDDSSPDAHPGATELCNGVDDNCNGHVDEEGACGGDVCEEKEDGVSCGGQKICHQGECCDHKSNCAGKECGPDGCGTVCGFCAEGQACEDGACQASVHCELILSVSGPGGYIPEAVVDNLESCVNFQNMFCNYVGNICSWDCWGNGGGGSQQFMNKCNSGNFSAKELLLVLIADSNMTAPGCILSHEFVGDCTQAPQPFL